jgi:hypothetical protein
VAVPTFATTTTKSLFVAEAEDRMKTLQRVNVIVGKTIARIRNTSRMGMPAKSL